MDAVGARALQLRGAGAPHRGRRRQAAGLLKLPAGMALGMSRGFGVGAAPTRCSPATR